MVQLAVSAHSVSEASDTVSYLTGNIQDII